MDNGYIQLILELKTVLKDIIQSFLKFNKVFFGTLCRYIGSNGDKKNLPSCNKK